MKSLIIIAEGETEQEFVKNILRPYFIYNNICHSINCFKITHSKGGVSKYNHIRKDIINSIYNKNAIVTTMIDYYRLPSSFPKFKESKEITNKIDRISFLENAVKEDIEKQQNISAYNLIPYIQLHEYEAILFSSMEGFNNLFEPNEANLKELENIINSFEPEEINEYPETAPSMRLKKLINRYNKVSYGSELASIIGIEKIIERCPHFSNWIEKMTIALQEK